MSEKQGSERMQTLQVFSHLSYILGTNSHQIHKIQVKSNDFSSVNGSKIKHTKNVFVELHCHSYTFRSVQTGSEMARVSSNSGTNFIKLQLLTVPNKVNMLVLTELNISWVQQHIYHTIQTQIFIRIEVQNACKILQNHLNAWIILHNTLSIKWTQICIASASRLDFP